MIRRTLDGSTSSYHRNEDAAKKTYAQAQIHRRIAMQAVDLGYWAHLIWIAAQ